MTMFDEPGSFYICTETSPRCYIIQKVSAKHVDQVVSEIKSCVNGGGGDCGELGHTDIGDQYYVDQTSYVRPPATPPPLPCLPYWFTTEAESELAAATGSTGGLASVMDFPVMPPNTNHYAQVMVAPSTSAGGDGCTSDSFTLTHSSPSTTGQQQQATSPLQIVVDSHQQPTNNHLPAQPSGHSSSSASGQPHEFAPGSTYHHSQPHSPQKAPLTHEELLTQLRQQLEYYFSPLNLRNDRYLWTQMDGDQYVSIKVLAGFRRILHLTSDLELIKTALRESEILQMDEKEERVRAPSKRCTILLRDVQESTKEEIEALFAVAECPKVVSIEAVLSNSWYVTFATDDDTQQALQFLYAVVQTFKGKPITARIKTSKAPGPSAATTPGASAPGPIGGNGGGGASVAAAAAIAQEAGAGGAVGGIPGSASTTRQLPPPSSLPLVSPNPGGVVGPPTMSADTPSQYGTASATTPDMPFVAASSTTAALSPWSPSLQQQQPPVYAPAGGPPYIIAAAPPQPQFDLGPQLQQAGFHMAGVYRPPVSVMQMVPISVIESSANIHSDGEQQAPLYVPAGPSSVSTSTMNVNAAVFRPSGANYQPTYHEYHNESPGGGGHRGGRGTAGYSSNTHRTYGSNTRNTKHNTQSDRSSGSSTGGPSSRPGGMGGSRNRPQHSSFNNSAISPGSSSAQPRSSPRGDSDSNDYKHMNGGGHERNAYHQGDRDNNSRYRGGGGYGYRGGSRGGRGSSYNNGGGGGMWRSGGRGGRGSGYHNNNSSSQQQPTTHHSGSANANAAGGVYPLQAHAHSYPTNQQQQPAAPLALAEKRASLPEQTEPAAQQQADSAQQDTQQQQQPQAADTTDGPRDRSDSKRSAGNEHRQSLLGAGGGSRYGRASASHSTSSSALSASAAAKKSSAPASMETHQQQQQQSFDPNDTTSFPSLTADDRQSAGVERERAASTAASDPPPAPARQPSPPPPKPVTAADIVSGACRLQNRKAPSAAGGASSLSSASNASSHNNGEHLKSSNKQPPNNDSGSTGGQQQQQRISYAQKAKAAEQQQQQSAKPPAAATTTTTSPNNNNNNNNNSMMPNQNAKRTWSTSTNTSNSDSATTTTNASAKTAQANGVVPSGGASTAIVG